MCSPDGDRLGTWDHIYYGSHLEDSGKLLCGDVDDAVVHELHDRLEVLEGHIFQDDDRVLARVHAERNGSYFPLLTLSDLKNFFAMHLISNKRSLWSAEWSHNECVPLNAVHTACGHRIAHRKWKDTKLQPGLA